MKPVSLLNMVGENISNQPGERIIDIFLMEEVAVQGHITSLKY